MKVYLYDGSFEGLLTAIFYGFTELQLMDIQRMQCYQPNLLSEPQVIATEPDKAQRVLDSIEGKLSSFTLRNVYSVYLSEITGCEWLALNYLKLCFRHSDQINMAKQHQQIRQVDQYRRKVGLEAQRFRGFVRFSEVAPMVFYANIEPDHNVLPLLVRHFVTRFSDQHFMIHDLKRQYALIYNLQQHYFREITDPEAQQLAELQSQDQYQQLFKIFFEAINIPERANAKQQKGYMPKRYWKHLDEVDQS